MGYGDNGHRHDSLRDILFSAAQSTPFAPRKEIPSLITRTNSRPADIFLPNRYRNSPAALDIAIISTLQSSTLPGAANTKDHALRVGEERKMAAHNESCQAVGISFVPPWWSNHWEDGAKRCFLPSAELTVNYYYESLVFFNCNFTPLHVTLYKFIHFYFIVLFVFFVCFVVIVVVFVYVAGTNYKFFFTSII